MSSVVLKLQSFVRRGLDAQAAVDQVLAEIPLRRCEDCKHHLGDVLLAVGRCPLFGQKRHGVETRCAAFVPRENAVAP